MSYSAEEMLLLLLTIKHSPSSLFVMNHLSYEKVGDLGMIARDQGLIIEVGQIFQLTSQGNDYINMVNNSLGRKGIERAIARIPDVIIKKISLEDIYLPEKM